MAAPLWFKAPFKVLQLFVREKLRDRIYTGELAEDIGMDIGPLLDNVCLRLSIFD